MLKELSTDAQKIFNDYIKEPKPMIYTQSDHHKHETANQCHICGEVFTDCKGGRKVRDHCHILGTYRGAAHSRCNLNYKIDPKRWKLPVFFHNLRSYDGHILIKALGGSEENIRIIPNNMEKYMAFSVGQLQFLDSYQFTMKSLDNLVQTLDDEDFNHTRQEYTSEQFKLVKQKGIFPYDFFDDISSRCSSHHERHSSIT